MDEQRAKQIAALNDQFRLKFFVPTFGPRPVPGHIVCTRGISALPPHSQICIWSAVSEFSASQVSLRTTPSGDNPRDS